MADEKKEEKTLEEAFSELDVLAGRLEDRETCLLYTSPSPRDA